MLLAIVELSTQLKIRGDMLSHRVVPHPKKHAAGVIQWQIKKISWQQFDHFPTAHIYYGLTIVFELGGQYFGSNTATSDRKAYVY